MMTKTEADELANDLKAIKVDVRAVKLNERTGSWEVYCWSPDPAEFYWVKDANLFRDAVHEGLTPLLPRGALDKKRDKPKTWRRLFSHFSERVIPRPLAQL